MQYSSLTSTYWTLYLTFPRRGCHLCCLSTWAVATGFYIRSECKRIAELKRISKDCYWRPCQGTSSNSDIFQFNKFDRLLVVEAFFFAVLNQIDDRYGPREKNRRPLIQINSLLGNDQSILICSEIVALSHTFNSQEYLIILWGGGTHASCPGEYAYLFKCLI